MQDVGDPTLARDAEVWCHVGKEQEYPSAQCVHASTASVPQIDKQEVH